MNAQKGFSTILIVVIGLLVIGGGIYFLKPTDDERDVQKEQEQSVEESIENNLSEENKNEEEVKKVASKSVKDVSVGEKMGDMTVVSVEPFNSGQYSDDPEFIKLSQDNAKIKLKGPITITGMYRLIVSGDGFSGYCMSDFDEESIVRLPSLSFDTKNNFFCFRNEEFARNKLGESQIKTKVTVQIDNFEINSYPSGVVDWADLVEVISREKNKKKTEIYIDTDNAFSIEYPVWNDSEDIPYRAFSEIFLDCPGAKIAGAAQCPFVVQVMRAENVENFISKFLSQNNLKLKTEVKNEKINDIKTLNFITVTNDVLELEKEVTIFLGEKIYVLIYNLRPDLLFVNEDYKKIISGFKFLSN